jgi:hypothetical protein
MAAVINTDTIVFIVASSRPADVAAQRGTL